MNKNKAIIQFIAFILVLAAVSIIFFKPLVSLFSNADNLKNFILQFGSVSIILFILLAACQVLIAPIPGQAMGFAGGYIFGAFQGFLYSMMGLIIGSYFAFRLSRKFGRPFVEKIVDKRTLNKFDNISGKRGPFILFLIYLLPFLPDDAVCYIAGLTKIKITHLVIISAIGRFPGFMVLSIVGAGFASDNSVFSMILLASLMIISFLIYLFRNRLEKLSQSIIPKR